MRLQKYLAICGVASRRQAENLIAAGYVKVDGAVINTMGFLVAPGMVVEVNGRTIHPTSQKRYILLNKPQGVITSTHDPQGRTTVLDLIQAPERIFPVGRLDYDTEGLLLLTNDGEMAQKLTHPSGGIEKLYIATIKGELSKEELRALEAGVALDDGYVTLPAKIEILSRGSATVLSITVREGHNRMIRRMCAAVGHPIAMLRREGYGPLRIGYLKSGHWRNLSASEIVALWRTIKKNTEVAVIED